MFDLRDRLPRAESLISGYDDLLALIDCRNAAWVEAARPLSASLLIEQLALTDGYVHQLFCARPADELAGIGVAWAGETRSRNWFDIAREYTEKWLHQQHIREAAGQPILAARRWLYPVLDTFVRALPHAYRHLDAPEGMSIVFQIVGEAGGDWSLLRRNGAWALYTGAAEGAAARVRLDQDLAWRLFTKEIARRRSSRSRAIGRWGAKSCAWCPSWPERRGGATFRIAKNHERMRKARKRWQRMPLFFSRLSRVSCSRISASCRRDK